jgi:hypothetical protein
MRRRHQSFVGRFSNTGLPTSAIDASGNVVRVAAQENSRLSRHGSSLHSTIATCCRLAPCGSAVEEQQLLIAVATKTVRHYTTAQCVLRPSLREQ